jgi:hypothetical protein
MEGMVTEDRGDQLEDRNPMFVPAPTAIATEAFQLLLSEESLRHAMPQSASPASVSDSPLVRRLPFLQAFRLGHGNEEKPFHRPK